jgi:hypothetical protein
MKVFGLIIFHFACAQAWVTQVLPHNRAASTTTKGYHAPKPSSRVVCQAGFGGDSKSKEVKIKPKQQWDRYLDLKKEDKSPVAVRVIGEDEWLEVGSIKSKENSYTELSVARQRALIADVSLAYFSCCFVLSLRTNWSLTASLLSVIHAAICSTRVDCFLRKFRRKIV